MTGASASVGLPAAHDHVDIKRIELEPAALPAGAFCGHQRRAAAQEGIEDDIAAPRTVENGVSDHRDGFDGRVERGEMAFLARASKGQARRHKPRHCCDYVPGGRVAHYSDAFPDRP